MDVTELSDEECRAALTRVLRQRDLESRARDLGWPSPELIGEMYGHSDEPVGDVISRLADDPNSKNLTVPGFATNDVRKMSPERYREWRKEAGLA